jgi:hypothetical protein
MIDFIAGVSNTSGQWIGSIRSFRSCSGFRVRGRAFVGKQGNAEMFRETAPAFAHHLIVVTA